jgi:hypothetical protein
VASWWVGQGQSKRPQAKLSPHCQATDTTDWKNSGYHDDIDHIASRLDEGCLESQASTKGYGNVSEYFRTLLRGMQANLKGCIAAPAWLPFQLADGPHLGSACHGWGQGTVRPVHKTIVCRGGRESGARHAGLRAGRRGQGTEAIPASSGRARIAIQGTSPGLAMGAGFLRLRTREHSSPYGPRPGRVEPLPRAPSSPGGFARRARAGGRVVPGGDCRRKRVSNLKT